MGILEGVIAGFIVAALTGAVGYFFGRKTYEQRVAAAPALYTEHIGKLISDSSTDNARNIRNAAQAIVSTRNDLKKSLTSLAQLLNSDIDVLAELIESNATPAQLADRIKVLEMKWPAKRTQVEVELRKILAELGLSGRG
ncbi:MAG: hypothetical protein IPP03_02010 [Dechloromonas sp.]|nr:hypothetical protein [Candidatus Dechloromonas phosphoritropha]